MKRETVMTVVGFALLAGILTLGFRAYLNPNMLLEFTNLLRCF